MSSTYVRGSVIPGSADSVNQTFLPHIDFSKLSASTGNQTRQDVTVAATTTEEIVFPEVKNILLIQSDHNVQISTDFDGSGATYAANIALQAKGTLHLIASGSIKKVSIHNPDASVSAAVNVFAI
jgi:hypothetical protein